MTSKIILFVVLATACFVERIAALSCPCWWYEPTPEDPRSYSERYCDQNLRCPPEAQVITDMCGCCDACSKIKEESCGGAWFYAGWCSVGLVCRDEYGNDPMTMPSGTETEGTCVLPATSTHRLLQRVSHRLPSHPTTQEE